MLTPTPTPAKPIAAALPPLAYLPVPLFATVMGLGGTTLAAQKAEHLYGWGAGLSTALLAASWAVYLAVALAYALKWLRHREQVVAEFNHPVRLSFFPTLSIGLLLLAAASWPVWPALAGPVWALGALVQLAFTLAILTRWMHQAQFQITHSNPAWFIPIVGNIVVPIAGVALGQIEVSWFFFSVGLLMWIPLLAVLLNRFFFHPMLPGKLLPTLFILIAPPAVGMLAWMRLHAGALDDLARLLYHFALFTALLLAVQWRVFAAVAFALPWWAYSFPSAALTIATLTMAEKTGAAFFVLLSPLMLASLAVLMTVLVFKTVRALLAGQVCVPE